MSQSIPERQVILQELQAPGAIGTLAERQRAAAKLEVLAQDGSETELQDTCPRMLRYSD